MNYDFKIGYIFVNPYIYLININKNCVHLS